MITKEYLLEEYVNKKRSMVDISKELSLSPQTIMRKIHFFKIKINKYPLAWNSGKTYLNDNRILAKEKHPRTKNTEYYNCDFKRLRKELLPCKCNRCNNLATLLHHKDENKMNNVKDNLEPLCNICHVIHHNKNRGFTTYKHICENPECNKEFIVFYNKKCNQKYCSLSCKSRIFYLSGKSPLFNINSKKRTIK